MSEKVKKLSLNKITVSELGKPYQLEVPSWTLVTTPATLMVSYWVCGGKIVATPEAK